jgi:hypothetical protein
MLSLALASAGCSHHGQIRLASAVGGNAAVDSTGTQALLSKGNVHLAIREANFVHGSETVHSYLGQLIIAVTNEGKKPVQFGNRGVLLVTSFGLPGPEEPPPPTLENSQVPDNVGRDGVTLQPGQAATFEFKRITFYPKFLFLRYNVDGDSVQVLIRAGVRYY